MPPGTFPKQRNSATVSMIRIKGQRHLNYYSPSARIRTTSFKNKRSQWMRMVKQVLYLNESTTKTYINKLRH